MGKVKKLIGYKAFDKDMKCRDFQYKVGETYIEKKDISLCNRGFHFCENPLDVLTYYPITSSRFAMVEGEGVSDETSSDSKRVAKRLTIKTELALPAFIKASIDFVWGQCKDSATSGNDANSATSGNSANSVTSGDDANSATSGEYAHSATSGNSANSVTSGYSAHSATSGNDANSATSGNRANSATSGNDAHSVTSGYSAHSATSGNSANSVTSGDDANSATSGEYAHSATSGNRANSVTSGYSAHSATSTGDAIACSIGRKAKAKASKGSWIVLAEWHEGNVWEDAKPIAIKSAQVDGKKVKSNQWYKLVGGEFVETDDSNE